MVNAKVSLDYYVLWDRPTNTHPTRPSALRLSQLDLYMLVLPIRREKLARPAILPRELLSIIFVHIICM